MKKVKSFEAKNVFILSEMINGFIQEESAELIDVQYHLIPPTSVANTILPSYHCALITYKKKKKKKMTRLEMEYHMKNGIRPNEKE